MKCSQIQLYLKQYHDGVLDTVLTQEISAHIRSCDACAQELTFLQSYLHTVKKIPVRKAPAQFTAKVNQKITGMNETVRHASFVKKLLPLPVPATAFAGIVLVIIIIAATYNPFKLALNKQDKNLAPVQPASDKALAKPKTAANVPRSPVQLADKEKEPVSSVQTLADGTGRPGGNNMIPVLTLMIKAPVSGDKKKAAPAAAFKSSRQLNEGVSDDTGSPSSGSAPNAEIDQTGLNPVIEKIRAVIMKWGGTMELQSARSGSQPASELLVTLPTVHYQDFLSGIRQFGELKEPVSAFSKEQEMITIKLELMIPWQQLPEG